MSVSLPNVIAASILSANLTTLGQEVRDVLQAGADWIHFDAMDNHYVPNLTFGPGLCDSLRQSGISCPIDVHLMMQPVDNIIPAFAKAGATSITFHPEASLHVDRTLQLIKNNHCQAGLALNPATSVDTIKHVLHHLDMLLLMSVNPGFPGQAFIPSVIEKVREARKIIKESGREIRLEVDGGINDENIRALKEAGADTFVIGSALFKTNDYSKTIKLFRDNLK